MTTALEPSLLPCTPILTARPVTHDSHLLLWGHSYQTALYSSCGKGILFVLSLLLLFCFTLMILAQLELFALFFVIVLFFDIVMLL